MLTHGEVFVPPGRLDEALRQVMAEAAFSGFIEEGVRSTTPRRIAERAGLPVDQVLRVCRSHAEVLALICDVRAALFVDRLSKRTSRNFAKTCAKPSHRCCAILTVTPTCSVGS